MIEAFRQVVPSGRGPAHTHTFTPTGVEPSIIAIDPGNKKSAWLALSDDYQVSGFDVWENEQLLSALRDGIASTVEMLVIEKIESYGMAVGMEVFDTVFWTGRFAEAADPLKVARLGRKAIKIALCGSLRAKDANIRQALIDRYGGAAAVGRKASPGPLYGISGDVWAALAVAVAWTDGAR